MQLSFSTDEIIDTVKPVALRGATTRTVTGIAPLAAALPGELSFLGNARYRADIATSKASVIFLPKDFKGEPGPDQLYLLVENPSVALLRLCSRLQHALWPKPQPGIHPSAVVSPQAIVAASATVGPLCVVEANATVGERVHLQAQVFVGRGAKIGDDSWLMPGTHLAAECVLGKRVQLQAGAVIGADGFGYEFVAGRHEKVPQIGDVVIGDDVEVGANSTVDRARFSTTRIGEGTKLDNLVQVGHNVIIGRHCLICAQTGISGSTTLEDYVVLGGQVGVAGHITLGKGSKSGAQAGIGKDLAPGSAVWGTPAIPYNLETRFTVLRSQLPELFKRVAAIEEELKKASE